jgi:hypothetical protein
MCWTPPYTRQKTKINKTKNTTQYVLDTTIHKTKDEDNVFCLVYGGIQHILCCVFCFVCLRLVSCVLNVSSFSGMSIHDCPFSFYNFYCQYIDQSSSGTCKHNRFRLSCTCPIGLLAHYAQTITNNV